MLHKTAFPTIEERVADLNIAARNADPLEILEIALDNAVTGRTALVSSFGAESVVLLHMISKLDRNLPVLFLDTEMLFKETLSYQLEVAQVLALSDIRKIRPDAFEVVKTDPLGTLNQFNKDACCDLRKSRPLLSALTGIDTWITGRKQFQSGTRTTLTSFENDGDRRIKVNPLAHWQPQELQQYFKTHNLPKHPLIARGYPSIGCEPCTTAVQNGEDTRAGRWRESDKSECGIHFAARPAQQDTLTGGA